MTIAKIMRIKTINLNILNHPFFRDAAGMWWAPAAFLNELKRKKKKMPLTFFISQGILTLQRTHRKSSL